MESDEHKIARLERELGEEKELREKAEKELADTKKEKEDLCEGIKNAAADLKALLW